MQAQTFWKLRPSAVILLISMPFLAPMPADAVEVTFTSQNGKTEQVYAIEVVDGSTFNTLTFGGNPADLSTTPWWGANVQAVTSFAELYDAATLGIRTTSIYFATRQTGPGGSTVSGLELFADGNINNFGFGTSDTLGTFGISDGSFVRGYAVPEIDGPILARMSLILFALYLGIKITRQHSFGTVSAA